MTLHRPCAAPRRLTFAVVALAALAACGGAGPAAPGPGATVAAVSPASGPAAGGTVLTIEGAGFVAGSEVRVGGAPAAEIRVEGAGRVTAVTPPHAGGPCDVEVISPGGVVAAARASFRYVEAPALSSLAPGHVPAAGGTVILRGAHFAAGASVRFGGALAAAPPDRRSAEELVAVAGAQAPGLVDVTVENPDGQRSTLPSALRFDAEPPPPPPPPAPLALDAVAPAAGPEGGGTVLTLTGAGFDASASVTVGGVPATVTASGAGALTAVAPPHAPGRVDVAVANPGGASATLAGAFTYVAAPAPPPAVTAVAPASGPVGGGTLVTVSGAAFQAGAAVTFDGAPAALLAASPDQLLVQAPAHSAGAVAVTVANADGQSATLAAAFTYVAPPPPPPSIVGVAPGQGPEAGGAPVTVSGANFQAGATVRFGGVAAVVASVTPTAISATTPAHAAGPVEVAVTNPDGQVAALAAAYAYLAPPPPPAAPPVLAAASPAEGPEAGGTVVTLSGSGFQPGATVDFGGAAAAVSAASATALSVEAPPHAAGPVAVRVTNPDGQAATLAGAYTYLGPPPPPPILPAPVLAGLLPSSGPSSGGAAVALSGAGFQAGAAVAFGGAPAAVVSVADAAIAVVAPAHAAGAVDVTVVNPDGQAVTLPAAYAYLAPPAVLAVSPAGGPTGGGTAVTVGGTGFQAGAAVRFGDATAVVGAVTPTAISATTPVHVAGPVTVTVTNPDGQAAALPGAFTYAAPPPVLSAVSPASGATAGGEALTLAGSGFQAGAAVAIGGAPAQVTSVAPTAITVTAPAHAAGSVTVTVTNPDGQAAALAGAYAYLAPPPPPPPPAPAVLSVTPAAGPTAGGTAAVLAGAGFAPGLTVTVGGAAAAVGGVSATAVAITTPPGAAGAADVIVTNPDGQASTLAGGFTYLAPPPAPTLQSVAPASGDVAGGAAVVLGGAGFAAGAGVTFGGVAAAVTSASATALTVTAPPHAAGAVDVTVTNPDGQAATLAGAFTYASAPAGAPPVLSGLSPASGYTVGGATVTLTGAEFVNPVVDFGGVVVVPSASSKTSITVAAPPHAAGAVDVAVINQDGQRATRAGAFTYLATPIVPPPVITSVSPGAGPEAGNTVVTITGTGFAAGAAVSFGGVDGLFVAVTATTITATTPGGPAGPVDVTVTNFDRQAATAAGAFTYVAPPPVVTAINVRGSPQAGGGLLLFAGTGLANTTSVTFGGAPATGLAYDPALGTLTVTVPPSPLGPTADGFVDLVLTNRDGQATTRPGFHYGNPPLALSFTPTTAQKGDTVVITGLDFSADASGPRAGLQVQFGGVPATITARSPTEISVTVPKMNPGSYPIVVVNFDSQFSVAPGTFLLPGP